MERCGILDGPADEDRAGRQAMALSQTEWVVDSLPLWEELDGSIRIGVAVVVLEHTRHRGSGRGIP